MARVVDAGLDSALQASHVRAITFVAFDFGADGIFRVCTADHDIAWNGFTWQGAGLVGTIETVDEGIDLTSRGIRMTLSGVSASLIAIALGTHIQGQPLQLWFGAFSTTDWSTLNTPAGPFQYRLDTMRLRNGKRGVIEISARDRLADWDRPRIRRYNNIDQQAVYPGDKFFEFAEQMVDKPIVW